MSAADRRFAVFILTHGRADRVYTFAALRKCGYTGKIYLLCDDDDEQVGRYVDAYGQDSVIVFNKSAAVDATDSADNFKKRNSIVYARNWNFGIAADLGLTHFWQLDDDYTEFGWSTDNDDSYIKANSEVERTFYTSSLDDILPALCDFMDGSGALSVAMAQGGDFVAGAEGPYVEHVREGTFTRKVMNSFILRVDRPVKFMGHLNEDVSTYVEWGRRGKLFITVPRLRLWQKETQSNAGGMTDAYSELGTYVKSFYTVMYAPSCVKIGEVGGSSKRIHHHVSWRHAVPKIIDEQYRKPRG